MGSSWPQAGVLVSGKIGVAVLVGGRVGGFGEPLLEGNGRLYRLWPQQRVGVVVEDGNVVEVHRGAVIGNR